MRSLTIQIPQPCHERWDEMQPTERGRFCASCQKTVVDYTVLSDQELVRLLSKASETSCGRFRNEQLNRQLSLSNPSSRSVWRHWVGLLTMGLFGWQTARAQHSQAPKSSQPTSIRSEFEISSTPVQATNSEKKWVIQGRVMLMDSSGQLLPASDATVSASQFAAYWQTQTDSTGAFELQVSTQKPGSELTIGVNNPYYFPGKVSIPLSASTPSIRLDNIILHRQGTGTLQLVEISVGGICVVQPPSRWRKIKRKLLR